MKVLAFAAAPVAAEPLPEERDQEEVAPYMEKPLMPLSTFKEKVADILEEYFISEDVEEVLT